MVDSGCFVASHLVWLGAHLLLPASETSSAAPASATLDTEGAELPLGPFDDRSRRST